MTVLLSPQAAREFDRLPRAIQLRVVGLIERLEHWPKVSGAKPLTGRLAGKYRLRTGDYRLQFIIRREDVLIERIVTSRRLLRRVTAMIAQKLTIQGKRYVLIEESEFRRLRTAKAGSGGGDVPPPALPVPDEAGNYPALQYARASLARGIVRDRKAAGLSQQALAKLAGIRQETLSRIESGKNTPSAATVRKIDHALAAARRRRR